jgi:hypothetical protein
MVCHAVLAERHLEDGQSVPRGGAFWGTLPGMATPRGTSIESISHREPNACEVSPVGNLQG